MLNFLKNIAAIGCVCLACSCAVLKRSLKTSNQGLAAAAERAKQWDATSGLVYMSGESVSADGASAIGWQYGFRSEVSHLLLSIKISSQAISVKELAADPDQEYITDKLIDVRSLVDSTSIIRQSIGLARQQGLSGCRWDIKLRNSNSWESTEPQPIWLARGKCGGKDIDVQFNGPSAKLVGSHVFAHPEN